MTTLIIEIKWSLQSTEYVSLDTENLPERGSTVQTTEFWKEISESVDYLVTCESHEINGSVHKFRFRYEPSDNTHLGAKSEDVSWGHSDVSIDLLKLEAKATWTGIYDSESDGTARCAVNSINRDLLQHIEYESFLRIFRPEQAKLREKLLTKDKRCAISRESTHQALDAAHIFEVRDGGVSDDSNSFLLRADLHRLFDRRLLNIQPDGKISFDESVSAFYREQFSDTQIDRDVLERIAVALQRRAAVTRA